MVREENPGVAVLLNVVPSALKPEAVPDGVVLHGKKRSTKLRSVWAGQGFPADVTRVLADPGIKDESSTDVVTALRMSPGSVKMLEERDISWADADGYATITAPPDLYISRLRPRPLPRRATSALNWSPSAEAVTEFVLCRRARSSVDPPHGWQVDRTAVIAEATRISQGQVAKVLVMLDEEGYTAKSGPERGPTATRELRDSGRLLSDWAGHYARSARTERRADLHVLSRDAEEWTSLVGDRLALTPWAVSGWLGADTVAPFATSVPDMLLYVPEGAFDDALGLLSEAEGVSVVERGGRIRLRSAPPYVFDFTTRTARRPIVSPVRLYADLLRSGGRGADAAQHLREVAIGF